MKTISKLFITLFLITTLLISFMTIPQVNNFINNLLNKTNEIYQNINDNVGLTADGNLVNNNELDDLEDSNIKGESLTFNTTYYPYYSMLNDEHKKLYKQVYANAQALKTTFIPIIDIDIDNATNVIESVYNDHPELFWLGSSYSYKYTEDNKCVQVILNFNELANNLDYYKNLFDINVNKILVEANKYNTNYEKEKYVHDILIQNIEYDESSDFNQSAFSGLVTFKTVCAGYARAFQYIMTKLNIPTYYVTGFAKEDHAWNIVKLADGYYNVDLTWDDSTKNYDFFNKTDTEFNESHKRTGNATKLPNCTATNYSYSNVKNNYTYNETTYEDTYEENSENTYENNNYEPILD